MADRFRLERLSVDENGVPTYAVYDRDQRDRELTTVELVRYANALDRKVLQYENRERQEREPEGHAGAGVLGLGCGFLTLPILVALVAAVCCGLTLLVL